MKRLGPASPCTRNDGRIILHFDYDCFYAAVFEAENPALKNHPLAVQQKQIVVTCNYEARRRGLHKLQLITEAKNACPELLIVLGEDLTRFRNASKSLYSFLLSSIWNDRAERLGFDEVFLDCTDMIDYNMDLLNYSDRAHSFFCLDKGNPTIGFPYSATAVSGPTYPQQSSSKQTQHDVLYQRLVLGSHLAHFLRRGLEQEKGYTATVGVSTNKTLSKLVGNVNKPSNQTTLLPPYGTCPGQDSNVLDFLDNHDIGKIPGIGFKLSQKLRAHILGRQPAFEDGLIYGGTREAITVYDVRTFPSMGPERLEDIWRAPGAVRGIGGKIWHLLHGVDEAEVGRAKKVPSQISIEDSYIRLVSLQEVIKELTMLSKSLIKRMHSDLTATEESEATDGGSIRYWLAHPRTLRMSTRPRPPCNPDGSRPRSFNRISRSVPMPAFTYSLTEDSSVLAERLVRESLLPAFKTLHPEKAGWNLSLMNVAATNMVETATNSKDGQGRDISKMLRQQDDVLKEWRLPDVDIAPEFIYQRTGTLDATADVPSPSFSDASPLWDSDEDAEPTTIACQKCGVSIPQFAMVAHQMFHDLPE